MRRVHITDHRSVQVDTSAADPATLIERALSCGTLLLRFAPVLEAQFEVDTHKDRTRMLVRYGVISLLLYDFGLINYVKLLPDVGWMAIMLQLGIVTPIAAAAVLYLRSDPLPFYRETVQLLMAVLTLVGAAVIYTSSVMPVAIFFCFSPVLTALFLNVVAHVRFPFALAGSAIILVVHAYGLYFVHGASGDAKSFITTSVVISVAFTLLANHRLEKEQRRAYLLHRRERLRQDEVTLLASRHKAVAERLRRLAHHDVLTDLANRALLQEQVSKALAQATLDAGATAVLCLDLDGFKAVNDLYGHAAGDDLLREVASRLRNSVRETDTVARLGGDEFVILQTGRIQPASARALADRLLAVLAAPYELNGGLVQAAITASIGVALFPGDASDPETLVHNADTALYQAKWAGKNSAEFFRSEMDLELRERRALERDLREAITRNEFTLDWQPLVSAGDARIVTGFEVLLRWHHPDRGLVPPDRFIPLAESCGAITAIGAWVLHQACEEAARWLLPLKVAVNVSPIQAQQGAAFASTVEQILAATGLAPLRLVLEVTEGILIRDPEKVLAALCGLKVLGVQVALDDFGTGYSSLATLRAFPFDKIKIDRSFVAGMNLPAGGQDRAIVKAVLGLAKGLGIPVVAEGVETDDQLSTLRAEGCEELQGWLVGRPASIATFRHLTNTPAAALDGATVDCRSAA